MMGSVRCPACGRDNAVETVRLYRVCAGCGAQLEAPPAQPATAQGAYPPGQAAWAPPPQAQPGPPPPYGAAAYYQHPPQYPYPYPYAYPQPYPPPYPYPYPYAYPMAPPPSTHPGLYDRPDEAPRLDLGALVRVLFRPRDAFRDLYHHTDMRTGLLVFFVLTLVEGLIALALNLTVLSDAESTGLDMFTSIGERIAYVTFGITLATGLAMFIGVCYLVHALLRSSPTTVRPSLPKTMGLLGYAAMPGLVMGVLTTVVVGAISVTVYSDEDATPWTIVGLAVASLSLAVVSLIWSLWVQGHAVSVANDAPWGKSAGVVFVSYIVVGMIVLVITALIIAVFGFSSIQGT